MNSGIDNAWIEAGVYGSATTRQILKCINIKSVHRIIWVTFLLQIFGSHHLPTRYANEPVETK